MKADGCSQLVSADERETEIAHFDSLLQPGEQDHPGTMTVAEDAGGILDGIVTSFAAAAAKEMKLEDQHVHDEGIVYNA